MNNFQKTKEAIKYVSRRYLSYDPGLRKIKIDKDFLDQKNLLSKTNVKVIFDVGANVGQTTQKYRKLFPRGKIYSFEPFPEAFKTYGKNNAGDKMVYKNQIALSNKTGKSSFFINKECHYANSLLPLTDEYKKENNYESESKIEIETDTVDNFCAKNKIDRVNILKMDVQGGEIFVLEGAQELLKSARIDLIYTEVEFYKLYENQPLFEDIEKFLKRYDYILYERYNDYRDDKNNLISADVIFYNPSVIKYGLP